MPGRYKALFFCLLFMLFSASVFGWQNGTEEGAIPFRILKGSIYLEATVNGVGGTYLLDTGAPGLLLNDRMFRADANEPSGPLLADLHGAEIITNSLNVSELEIEDRFLSPTLAMVMDFSRHEKNRPFQVAGILGSGVFRDCELVIDFARQEFFIEKSAADDFSGQKRFPTDSLLMKKNGHLLYVEGSFMGRKLRLALDTGSEVNLLNTEVLRGHTRHFSPNGSVLLAGIQDGSRRRCKGLVRPFFVGKSELSDFEAVITSLSDINRQLPVRMDGVLGFPFFQGRKVGFDFWQNKLYFYENEASQPPKIRIQPLLQTGLPSF